MVRLYSFRGNAAQNSSNGEAKNNGNENKEEEKKYNNNEPMKINPFQSPEFQNAEINNQEIELTQAPVRQANKTKIQNSPNLVLAKKNAPKKQMLDPKSKEVNIKFQKEINKKTISTDIPYQEKAQNQPETDTKEKSNSISMKERISSNEVQQKTSIKGDQLSIKNKSNN